VQQKLKPKSLKTIAIIAIVGLVKSTPMIYGKQPAVQICMGDHTATEMASVARS
jgi:hypothetical protein